MEELASNGVEIYRFPVDDETVSEMNAGMNVSKFYGWENFKDIDF